MKKTLISFLLLLCAVSYTKAQNNNDTLVWVYTATDTLVLNNSNAEILVYTFASNNGDGGFKRSTAVRLSLPDELCQRLKQSEINCFELKMRSLSLKFRDFEFDDSRCLYKLSDNDRGVRWSHLRYIYGHD